MVTMNVHPPQFISESCLYLSCGNELNVPSKLISQSSFPQYITLMETVSCFLLVSVSSYFYLSGAGLFSFSPYTALLILEQEIFFFPFVTSVPIFLWFSTLSILHLFCLIMPIASCVPGIHLLVLVCLQFQYGTYVPQASWNYFGMQCDWKTLYSWVAKIYLMSRWLLWQGCVL